MTEQEQIIEAKKYTKAFAHLYKKYHSQILLYCYQRVDDKSIASDMCSQTFMKALQNIKKYEDRGLSFGAWLYRIASNEINTYYKKNKRVINITDDIIKTLFEEIKVDNSEENKRLLIALKKLKPIQYQLLQVRFWEGRAFREIAEIMDITESNAKVKTYRVLDKLKLILTK